jgi:hypothetical protein
MKRSRLYYLLNSEKMRERSRRWREAVKNGTHIPTKRDDLYTTREELMKATEEGDGEIDWDVWDRLIQEFHEKYLNEEYLDRPKNKKGRVLKLRYIYNSAAQLVCSGSSMEVSEKLKEFGVIMSNDNVVLCCCNETFRHGFFFSNRNYSGHQILELKNHIKLAKQYGSMERHNRVRRNVPSE